MGATIVTIVTFLTAASAAAPDSPLATTLPGPWVVCATTDQDAACAHLSRAEALLLENRTRAAGRELERAVRARRAAGQYPGEELWRLAAVRFQLGQLRSALRALDELAREAELAGDLDRRATALVEAVILYADVGDLASASARLDRLRAILPSPYLPSATSTAIHQRLIGL